MKTFLFTLCAVDLIAFVFFLIVPNIFVNIFVNIFFVLFIFTMIMLIALGIIQLSILDDEDGFDNANTLTSHHPFVQWLRRHHGVD